MILVFIIIFICKSIKTKNVEIRYRKEMTSYVVKCAFSRSDGGPSPAVPLPVPPNDSGVGGT